jgi:hypothetical protein
MWPFREETLDQRMNELLKVRTRSSLYPGGASIPGTHHFSVSKDFKPEVAFAEIRRVARKLTDPDNGKPVHNGFLALRLNGHTASLFEYEAAGFPVILPQERDGVPESHRELLFFDYEKIAELPNLPDKVREALRKEHELNYGRFLHMVNEGINPCRADYLRMCGKLNDVEWLFKCDEKSYTFSAGISRKIDRPDVQEANVMYKVEVRPRVDKREPFKVTKLETRAMIYMKPRDDTGNPLVEEAHIRMGCFARVERYDDGPLRITSRVTRRMDGTLKEEAEAPYGWRHEPSYDYRQSIEKTALFFSALRHGSERLPSYLGKDGPFVLKK